MKITIDEQEYILPLQRTLELQRQLYKHITHEGVKTQDGSVIKIGKDSLIRTAIKMIITPMLIPTLRKLYADRGFGLEPPVKHADLLDYCVNAFIDWMKLVEESAHVKFTSTDRIGEDSYRTIRDVSALWSDRPSVESGVIAEETSRT